MGGGESPTPAFQTPPQAETVARASLSLWSRSCPPPHRGIGKAGGSSSPVLEISCQIFFFFSFLQEDFYPGRNGFNHCLSGLRTKKPSPQDKREHGKMEAEGVKCPPTLRFSRETQPEKLRHPPLILTTHSCLPSAVERDARLWVMGTGLDAANAPVIFQIFGGITIAGERILTLSCRGLLGCCCKGNCFLGSSPHVLCVWGGGSGG